MTLEEFNEFVLPHLPKGCRGLQPKLSLHSYFQLYFEALVPRVSVERAADRQGQRWATGAPLHQNKNVPLDALKPMGALMPFSSGLYRYFTRESTSTSVSSTAMVQPQQQKKAATILDERGHKHFKGDMR